MGDIVSLHATEGLGGPDRIQGGTGVERASPPDGGEAPSALTSRGPRAFPRHWRRRSPVRRRAARRRRSGACSTTDRTDEPTGGRMPSPPSAGWTGSDHAQAAGPEHAAPRWTGPGAGLPDARPPPSPRARPTPASSPRGRPLNRLLRAPWIMTGCVPAPGSAAPGSSDPLRPAPEPARPALRARSDIGLGPPGSARGPTGRASAASADQASMRERSRVAAELVMNSLRGATSFPISRSNACSAASRSLMLMRRSVRCLGSIVVSAS
jgi:hypothetical protein